MNKIYTILYENKRNILLLVGVIILMLACVNITGRVHKTVRTYLSAPALNLAIQFLYRWIWLLIPICFMRIEQMPLSHIGITASHLPSQVVTGIAIGSIIPIVYVGLTVLLGFKEQVGAPPYKEGWMYIFLFFFYVFAVAILEEVFFRGYIHTKILDICGNKWLAIILSSAIFGLFHISGHDTLMQAVPQVLTGFVMGIIYCLLREKIPNCTLITLIFIHGMYDFWISFLKYIVNRYTLS